MLRRPLQFLGFLFGALLATGLAAAERTVAIKSKEAPVKERKAAQAGAASTTAPANEPEQAPQLTPRKAERVYVIPVRDEIGDPVLYIVRRGLKEAIAQKADAVILDMKTPGGSLGTTLEIMEALAKFPGMTITYVNNEAMSAGAFISASTQEIWFAPTGIIGAAAPVSAGGKDVEATMRQKIVSYLKARLRATTEGRGYRGQVVSAMVDADYELKIGDVVLKPKGELLSLTAMEAAKRYGAPPVPLLSAGTARDLDHLIAQRFGDSQPAVTTLAVTWSEGLAVWLNSISAILLGLGMLALYIEFKTPGFGVFGVVGIACLAIVFLGSYVAGLSGHEPALVFVLGVILLALEIFFVPGIGVLALSGVVLMLGSVIWAMADLWPNEPLSVAWSGDAFMGPMINLSLGMLIAVGLGLALARFIPRGWVWDKMIVQSTVGGAAQISGGGIEVETEAAALIGRTGVAVTALRPSGQVEIDGRRYEARVEIGAVARGRPVVVRAYSDFGLVVEEQA